MFPIIIPFNQVQFFNIDIKEIFAFGKSFNYQLKTFSLEQNTGIKTSQAIIA